MCRGGRLLADFEAGVRDQPDVPEIVARSFTATADGLWVVWAHKVAHRTGEGFRPITGGEMYGWDAVAACRHSRSHRAPDAGCTCGFHAVSEWAVGIRAGFEAAHLHVALSGRVLAFEWMGGGVLFRAARQTVARVTTAKSEWPRRPSDPGGKLAAIRRGGPSGTGPIRLRLPEEATSRVAVDDDAGFCAERGRLSSPRPKLSALVTV
jgi:hypothetical protein